MQNIELLTIQGLPCKETNLILEKASQLYNQQPIHIFDCIYEAGVDIHDYVYSTIPLQKVNLIKEIVLYHIHKNIADKDFVLINNPIFSFDIDATGLEAKTLNIMPNLSYDHYYEYLNKCSLFDDRVNTNLYLDMLYYFKRHPDILDPINSDSYGIFNFDLINYLMAEGSETTEQMYLTLSKEYVGELDKIYLISYKKRLNTCKSHVHNVINKLREKTGYTDIPISYLLIPHEDLVFLSREPFRRFSPLNVKFIYDLDNIFLDGWARVLDINSLKTRHTTVINYLNKVYP